MAARGVEDIVDLTLSPFGNAYFVNDKCGGAGGYNLSARQCFNRNCGANSSRPAGCYKGDLLCQHGKQECDLNLYMQCAMEASSGKHSSLLPFMVCVEERYANGKPDKIAQVCSGRSSIDFAAVQACFAGSRGKELIKREAMATPEHLGVPWVLVNGVYLDDPFSLLNAVCDAYSGASPKGCRRNRSLIQKRRRTAKKAFLFQQ
mmetsp:Transcript_105304/g.298049  ORF Transcript_105304/g.298049 Transcript_105304/m.298049 type:complete len:204 (-) Transcript_105304:34-645(-)